ncbi:MAG TPA: hypothetical protein VLF17_02355 [Candidatus Nitrosotenuis sp.]|nr:hypothetical protein [Candidatus Nitrosotenuis sp.]
MRLTYVTGLVLLGVLIGISTQNASAQLGAGKAFTLEGNGYMSSGDAVLPTSVDLQFTIMKKGTTTEFTLQNGSIDINGKELDISNLSGTLLKNGQYFRVASKVSDSAGKEFSLKLLGTLMETTKTGSIYGLAGTITDSTSKSAKIIYTTKISEFTTTVKPTANKKNDVTVRILKGSSNPEQQTYVNQINEFSFRFLSEDRVSLGVGGTLTFANEDTVSHSLKSGVAQTISGRKSFIADNKFSSGDIQPGRSWSVTFQEPGFYRFFDEKYYWIDMTVLVNKDSGSITLGSSGKPHN